ncbi:D-glucuronyl C5-epimerase family protein [Luteococcus peritonei]|uniref:D-glucuronyl C5-epimerase family protein n=1 Tax=Luteococcus peritonei TaxID=88874 RepID=A0ABW4RTJ6_9ACTN
MNENVLSRRSLLTASSLGLLGAGLAPTADASTRWRMMSETVVSPPRPAWAVIPPSYRGLMGTSGPDGIPLLPLKDGRKVIHPTQLGNFLNSHLESYQLDKDRGHLAYVGQVTEALMKRSARRQGARFLAYEFDWHSRHGVLADPWYSAFGQAKFPRICYWMWEFTGQRKWQQYMQEVLQAFWMPPVRSRPAEPWIAGTDVNNCLWLEEYPEPGGVPSGVFNGHFYALSELAYFTQLSGDARTKDLVQGAAATLDFYRNYCRVPGSASNYHAFSRSQVTSYHNVNASVYTQLYNHTGAERIAKVVDQMVNDWPITGGAASLQVNPTPVQVMKLGATAPGTPRLWTPPAGTVLRSSTRARWLGFPGVWSHMNNGPYTGWFVRETAGRAFRLGTATDRVDFTRSRAVVFDAGRQIQGFRMDTGGRRVLARTQTLSRSSMAHSRSRALIAGQHHILIEDGGFAGLWIPENQGVHYR